MEINNKSGSASSLQECLNHPFALLLRPDGPRSWGWWSGVSLCTGVFIVIMIQFECCMDYG